MICSFLQEKVFISLFVFTLKQQMICKNNNLVQVYFLATKNGKKWLFFEVKNYLQYVLCKKTPGFNMLAWSILYLCHLKKSPLPFIFSIQRHQRHMNLLQGHKWQISVRQEVNPKRSCANSEATKNKWKTPTAAFSVHQGPNSFVSRKVPDYTALIYCLSPKSSQMWSHLHFKYTSSFSITSNAPYQTTHVDLILLYGLRTESSKPLNISEWN